MFIANTVHTEFGKRQEACRRQVNSYSSTHYRHEVTVAIACLRPLPASDRPASVKAVQRVLSDATELLEQMELAVRDLAAGSSERTKYELRARSYHNDKRLLVNELEKAIKRLRETADSDELLAHGEAVEMDQQKEQLIANTEKYKGRRGNVCEQCLLTHFKKKVPQRAATLTKEEGSASEMLRFDRPRLGEHSENMTKHLIVAEKTRSYLPHVGSFYYLVSYNDATLGALPDNKDVVCLRVSGLYSAL
uniref:V-SNARE domain-containing protein n=1 Tax=Angiostrongylus cantonensis TaxID=6313 RepID=A0A158PA87_ANGCA